MKVSPHGKFLPVAAGPMYLSDTLRVLAVCIHRVLCYWAAFKNARYKGGGEERLTPIPYKSTFWKTCFISHQGGSATLISMCPPWYRPKIASHWLHSVVAAEGANFWRIFLKDRQLLYGNNRSHLAEEVLASWNQNEITKLYFKGHADVYWKVLDWYMWPLLDSFVWGWVCGVVGRSWRFLEVQSLVLQPLYTRKKISVLCLFFLSDDLNSAMLSV